MKRRKRRYQSESRRAKAELSRTRILAAARKTFGARGFERATIKDVAELARVSAPLVYATFKSKEGLLRALIESNVFGKDYNTMVERITAEREPAQTLRIAAGITRLVYDEKRRQMGALQRAAILSPAIRRLEQDLENQRYMRQELVVRRLFDTGAIRPGLDYIEARDVLWSLTSRDLYRMLVLERKWSPDDYEDWLATLLTRMLLRTE